MSSARVAALKALLAVESGAKVQEALAGVVGCLSQADKQFCSDLVYGALRNQLSIEAELAKLLSQPENLPAPMLAVLRLAVYSIIFQDRVPDYAVVNSAVRMVKKQFGQKLGNVANGVLRRFIRLRAGVRAPAGKGPFSSSCLGQLPADITSLWTRSYGAANAELLVRRSLRRPWPALRVNSIHPAALALIEDLGGHEGAQRIAPECFAFPPGMMPLKLLGRSVEYWRDNGALSRQAAGSYKVMLELGLPENWRNAPVWDACAGFGGKSTLLLEKSVQVKLASDVNLKRLAGFYGECARLGLTCPGLMLADARNPPLMAWKGHILVDAPCSGLGVLARRPDIISRWRARSVETLAAAQQKILASLARLLQPGMEMAYITCTLNPDENENQIAALMAADSRLELARQWQTPFDHPWLEGMYGARIKRI